MDKLQLKAYGKINLGLDVIRKRPDGYHDLDMIMQMVDVYDDIIIEKKAGEEIVVKADAAVLSNGKDNLAYMAAKMLFDEFGIKSGVEITIHKRIPIAGGMAGGSSDCATTLIGINEMFNLGLSKQQLMERGVKLGADVPYCVLGGTAIARGIGEVLTPLPTPPQCHVIIAKPPISVSTAYVYGHIRPDEITKRPDIEQMTLAIKEQDLNKLSDLLYNVMEEVTVSEYPVIEKLKSIMLEKGALNSIMSGSGPTVFGLFDDREKAQAAMKALDSKELTEQLYLTKFI
ncbi:4-diphosphocytidyl-2-C-methyl-D-erythritol kinase [Eubacterium sp. CAG:192]|jgi:4-(cytidine 5'-diphospho)-2-C-methyl-D-erythritol kinase|uniref:4-(cytidine 5'-diphospho)-2-C-methyl-D-erythritol kinase n=1 Tax=Eubacterium sp. Marseille-QA0814 TaxID=3378778 RepID=UPI000339E209|nr:4-(cytidine 5'-diphospho)-2-C-methyl-D-erythritol kinase [uncultured Eubacterium sp.]CDB12379.1 4-diphosphocytidyl-2-C-methyl-D-erythritol kinase [Eubacterium sp. CAG:192]